MFSVFGAPSSQKTNLYTSLPQPSSSLGFPWMCVPPPLRTPWVEKQHRSFLYVFYICIMIILLYQFAMNTCPMLSIAFQNLRCYDANLWGICFSLIPETSLQLISWNTRLWHIFIVIYQFLPKYIRLYFTYFFTKYIRLYFAYFFSEDTTRCLHHWYEHALVWHFPWHLVVFHATRKDSTLEVVQNIFLGCLQLESISKLQEKTLLQCFLHLITETSYNGMLVQHRREAKLVIANGKSCYYI